MEDAMNALPDPIQKAIDTALRERSTPETPDPSTQLTTLDRDIADVQECLHAIGELNLFTALKVGLQALEQFTLKAKVSRDMFGSISVYAHEIADITDAFCNLDFKKIILHKIKAMWKCLKLSSLIKTLAEGLGNLIGMVIDLFEATSTKVAGLWKALAFAKDCMKDCIEHALKARDLCENAKTKSLTLIDRSIRVKDMLQDMGELNVGSIAAFRDLADGEEINTAINIAMEMDDIVLECASKAVSMVDRVREGYEKLPPMVTEEFLRTLEQATAILHQPMSKTTLLILKPARKRSTTPTCLQLSKPDHGASRMCRTKLVLPRSCLFCCIPLQKHVCIPLNRSWVCGISNLPLIKFRKCVAL
jgi:ribosomal protein L9